MKHLRLFLTAVVALLTGLTVMAQEDVTDTYLKNADLSSLDGWDYGDDGFNYTDWKTDGDVPVIEFYHTWNANAGTAIGNTRNFHFTQTVTLPAGNYRLAVNGFYREGNGNGTNTKAYIFAGEKTQYLVGLTSAGVASYSGSNDLYKAANAFTKGDFSNEFDFDLEQEQEITIGFRGYIDTYCSWCILGPVKLYKYSLEDYLVDYRVKVAEAQALYESPMNSSVLQELKNAVVEESNFSLSKDVTAAILTLTEKIANAKRSITVYEEAKSIIDAANSYDSYGQDSYRSDATIIDISSAYEARTLETISDDQRTAASNALTTACKAQQQPTDGCDMTAYIVNPSFNGNFDGWSKTITVNGNNQMFGDNAYEYWSYTAGSGGFDYFQNLEHLPEGFYTISADMFNDQVQKDGDTFAPAAGVYGTSSIGTEMKLVDVQGATFNTYTTGNITVLDGILRIGAKNETEEMPARWFVVDNFKLTYVRQITEEEKIEIFKKEYDEALTTARDVYGKSTVTQGFSEGIALKEEIDKAEPTTSEGYKVAANALVNATAAFNEAIPAYEAYVAETKNAQIIGVEVGDAPTTAADAITATNALKVAEYNYVETEYPNDYAPVIGTFGEWTGTATVEGNSGTPNYLSNEHWSGTTHAYYEQDAEGWGKNAWTIKYEKTATLPAGDYILKVAARASESVEGTLSCSATDVTMALPNVGAFTKGIDLDGKASFEGDNFARDGVGFGWEWRYLPFTLTEKTKVTMTVYGETNVTHNWMSIADGTLLSKQEIVNEVTIAGTDATVIEAQVATKVTTDRKLLSGLNTIVLPFEVTAEEIGAATVLAYTGTTAEQDATTVTLNFMEVTPVDGVITLQANTPYAVFVDVDQIENLTFDKTKNIAPAEDITTEDANGKFDFVGTYKQLIKNADDNPIQSGDMVAGETEFKKAAGKNGLKAYRAYLKKVTTTEPTSVAFNFDGEIVNGIEAVEILNRLSGEGDIYNLNGQKVNRAERGIYIINGKKVVVK